MRRIENLESPVVDDLTISGAEDEPVETVTLAFYRDDQVLVYYESGEPFARTNSIRGHNGSVEWLRFGGGLYRHQGVKQVRWRPHVDICRGPGSICVPVPL